MQRHVVRLGMPGPSFIFGSIQGAVHASMGKHDVHLTNSGTGWDDFNAVWCDALNAFEAGEVTHFAMLHSDITPEAGWLDILLSELDRLGADLVSAVSPIKDTRGLTSSGIGDPNNRWSPLRRFTVRELLKMPETFNAAEVGYEGYPLLHNTGCWVCDLRNPLFREEEPDGSAKLFFDFARRVYRSAISREGIVKLGTKAGRWVFSCESEDWYFSRKLHEANANSYITRKVKLTHRGFVEYPNSAAWGTYEHDNETMTRWKGTTECPVLM